MKKFPKQLYFSLFHAKPAVRFVTIITLFRIMVAPISLIFVFTGYIEIFKWLLLACFLTDAVDGFLARGLKAATPFGATLDSIGDDLTVLSGTIGLFEVAPDFFPTYWFYIVGMLVLVGIEMTVSLMRYKRMSSFHTYLAKLAAVLQAVFIMSMYFIPDHHTTFFYLALVVTALDVAEEIMLVFILPRWKINVKGLYWVLTHKQKSDQL